MGTGSVGSTVAAAEMAGDIDAGSAALGPLGDFIVQLAGANSTNQTTQDNLQRNLTRDALRQLRSGASINTIRRNLRSAVRETR